MLAWLSLCLGMVVIELRHGRRQSGGSAVARQSDTLMTLSSVSCLLWAPVATVFAPTWVIPGGAAVPIAGAAMAASGLLLRRRAMLGLGELFTLTPSIQRDHQVVDTGVYRIVRHPGYLALLLYFGGLTLIFGNLLAALAILPILLALPFRIAIEERDLVAQFGVEYINYRNRTSAAIIPGLI